MFDGTNLHRIKRKIDSDCLNCDSAGLNRGMGGLKWTVEFRREKEK